MLIGDSGTQVVPMNGDLDLRAWIDACAREGHSTVHIWAFTGPRPDDWRLGSGKPVLPWARRSDGSLNLLQFNEGADPRLHYWARLGEICRLARARGLLVGITVFYGWAKDLGPSAGWSVHPFNRSTGGFADSPSDVIDLAEEREIGAEAWDESWPPRRKAQWLWERYALRLIKEIAPYDNVWLDYRDEWSYLNAEAGRSEPFWRRFFSWRRCIWADRTGDGGLRVANPRVPRLGPTPAIKTEGGPYDHDGVRREVWQRAMSGIHYLLHNDERAPNIASWDPAIASRRSLAPSDDLGRRWVGICSRFFNRHVRDLDSLRPEANRVSEGALCMVGNAEIVVYVPAGHATVSVRMPEPRDAKSATYYDPLTGRTSKAVGERLRDALVFSTPDPSKDWTLHIPIR